MAGHRRALSFWNLTARARPPKRPRIDFPGQILVRMRSTAFASMLRSRDGDQRVTNIELFFDLVYVFAVTQLSHGLLDHLTVEGALQTALLLGMVLAGLGVHDVGHELARPGPQLLRGSCSSP